MLLDAGAQVEAIDDDGWSSVFFAAQNQHLQILTLLRGRGANLDLQNRAGSSPASFAALFGLLDALKHLASLGADLEAPDPEGATPLDAARLKERGECALFIEGFLAIRKEFDELQRETPKAPPAKPFRM